MVATPKIFFRHALMGRCDDANYSIARERILEEEIKRREPILKGDIAELVPDNADNHPTALHRNAAIVCVYITGADYLRAWD